MIDINLLPPERRGRGESGRLWIALLCLLSALVVAGAAYARYRYAILPAREDRPDGSGENAADSAAPDSAAASAPPETPSPQPPSPSSPGDAGGADGVARTRSRGQGGAEDPDGPRGPEEESGGTEAKASGPPPGNGLAVRIGPPSAPAERPSSPPSGNEPSGPAAPPPSPGPRPEAGTGAADAAAAVSPDGPVAAPERSAAAPADPGAGIKRELAAWRRRIRVGGIAWSPSEPRAFVNGVMLGVGDPVSSVPGGESPRLAVIHPHEVVFDYKGERFSRRVELFGVDE